MSGSSLDDPVMKMYEAQAIIVEKNQEIESMRQEIERLRMENSSKNQQKLAQKGEKLEPGLASKVTKLEEDLAASKADNLQLKEQITALHLNISKNDKLSDKVEELFANQTRNQKELAQKMIKLEEELAESKNKNLDKINHLTSLEMSVNQPNEKNNLKSLFTYDLVKSDLFKGFLAQNAARNENNVGKLSGGLQNTSVLILGGWRFLNTIYLLDSKAQSWKKLGITLPMGMQNFGVVVLNEEIYIFGGYSMDAYHQYCYKWKTGGSWMQLASMNQRRSNISSSSLVYKGDIWAIGGFNKDVHKSVEKYDISQNKWTYMPEMHYERHSAAAAVFKDRIFVTGGWGFTKILKSVETFDPKLQKWILFCDLPFEVYAHTMLISNSILSIFGGNSESSLLNSVWEMDIEDPEKKWTKKQSFKYPRWVFGIGKLSNGIIVFGGLRESRETSEIFDGKKWIYGPKLPQVLFQFAYISIPRSLEERFLDKFS